MTDSENITKNIKKTKLEFNPPSIYKFADVSRNIGHSPEHSAKDARPPTSPFHIHPDPFSERHDAIRFPFSVNDGETSRMTEREHILRFSLYLHLPSFHFFLPCITTAAPPLELTDHLRLVIALLQGYFYFALRIFSVYLYMCVCCWIVA